MYESTALQQYQKHMHAIGKATVLFKSGYVVCKEAPFLRASPEGKVIDTGCSEPYGVVEVKCPETKYRVTSSDACSDPSFVHMKLLENRNPSLTMITMHTYFQGQLGITQVTRCDFVIYTNKGHSIESIKYDHQYWIDMKNRLHSFYFDHFINLAATDYSTPNVA